MSTSPSETPTTPTWKPLSAEQRRVLGVLIEKAKTTPAGYPMSLNAIVAGSNQKSNRDPLMTLTDDDVEDALDQLRQLGVVTEAHESVRVAKFRHRGYEWLGVTRAELAVMTELLLRGAQSLGDLRGRAARMEPIADLAALKPVVEGLVARSLVIELTPAGRGQIVTHNLYLEPELAELKGRYRHGGSAPSHGDGARAPAASPAPAAASDARLEPLERAVEELRAEVERLRERVQQLESDRH